MAKSSLVTFARGDGIGPEIMDATLAILKAAGAKVEWEEIVVGQAAYLAGDTAGISEQGWESLRKSRLFLKAPVMTPQGKGFKSLNVTIRKTLGLYANVRPCVAYAPFVPTAHPHMDVVIIRENEEDLYAGIEHRQTQDVYQCLKLITRPGCERITRYAFEYARAHGRKKISCLSKDNIMKLTDGLFRRVFEEIGEEYPEIAKEHLIVDIGTARVATRPEAFDVVLTSNLYGDILSDVAAEVAGSVGLAPSSNVGHGFAMFEAIHGSAPDIAGRNIANPSGLLLSAVELLMHIGDTEAAENVKNAWLKTIEDGVHTKDLFSEKSRVCVGTKEFAEAVVSRLGQKPEVLQKPKALASSLSVQTKSGSTTAAGQESKTGAQVETKTFVGVDVFLDAKNADPDVLAKTIEAAQGASGLSLSLITNRGTRVWPGGAKETFCVDHWRCRMKLSPNASSHTTQKACGSKAVVTLLSALGEAGLDVVKTENLYEFNGERGYSLGQGEG